MNDVLLAPRGGWTGRRSLKRWLWNAANSVSLGGMFTLGLDRNWLLVEQLAMRMRGLGPGWHGRRIVHISDLHASPIVLDKYLADCVQAVNALEPDLICVTGDLVTGGHPYARRIVRTLGMLEPILATVVCLGNHDYGLMHPGGMGGIRGLADYIESLLAPEPKIHLLRNDAVTFLAEDNSPLQFVGLDEFWTDRYDPDEAFARARPKVPSVCLVHNPDATPDLLARGARWVLAGHTHGKVTPDARLHEWVWPMRNKHLVAGHYELGPGQNLYINRGLGHARRISLQNRQEITVFTLAADL